MNPWMLSDLTDLHMREIRREAARRRNQARPRESQPVRSMGGGPGRLRQRVGFGLVEAGLHVLTTTRSMP
jgi:hypothetical protein